MEKPSLTVLFITLNEEHHIGAAIDNVKDVAEAIYVVDSGSTDRTVAIAEEKGAKVVYHAFEGFGAQWNFALSLPITSDWTMKMDPDERLTDALKDELRTALKTDRTDIGYSCSLVLWFMGHRLDGVKMEIYRIWRTGKCHFTDISVNEHQILDGTWQHLGGGSRHGAPRLEGPGGLGGEAEQLHDEGSGAARERRAAAGRAAAFRQSA